LSQGRGKAADTQRRDGGFGATGHHHVGIAIFDHATGLADAVQTGGAGGDDGQVRAGEAVLDGQVARDHVDDRRRHEEGRNAARAALAVFAVGLLDHRQATDAGAHHAADALGRLLAQRVAVGQAGIAHRLDRRGQAEVDEGVHVAGLLAGEVILDIEALDLAGNAAGEGGRIETRDAVDAAAPGHQVGPTLGHAVAHRADQPEAGNDDAATAHCKQARVRPSGGWWRSRSPTAPW
jgi:hypothetical protein